jgi:hypothetical protein
MVGAGVAVYLIVLYGNTWWCQIVNGAQLGFALALLICSSITGVAGSLLLWPGLEKKRSDLLTLYAFAILLIFCCVIVILRLTSIASQHKSAFWIHQYITAFNNSRLSSEFQSAHGNEANIATFVRQRTLIPHDTVLVLTCTTLMACAAIAVIDQRNGSVAHQTDEEQIVSIEEQVDRSRPRSESSQRVPATVEENEGEAISTQSDEHEFETPDEEQTTVVYTQRVIPRRRSEVPSPLYSITLKSPPPPLEPPMVRTTRMGRIPRWMLSPNALSISETDSDADGSSDIV